MNLNFSFILIFWFIIFALFVVLFCLPINAIQSNINDPKASFQQVYAAKVNDIAHYIRQKHINKCGSVSDWPQFNPGLYNDHKYEKINNCYFYAFSDLNKTRDGKPQPLNYYHPEVKSLTKSQLNCPNLVERISKDHPGIIQKTKEDDECPCGYYEVVLMVATKCPVEDRDYHFAKRNSNGAISHKPGALEVTNKDASGNYIVNFYQADWDYSKHHNGVNYDKICGVFFVPNEPNDVYSTPSHEPNAKWESEIAENY